MALPGIHSASAVMRIRSMTQSANHLGLALAPGGLIMIEQQPSMVLSHPINAHFD